MQIKVKPYAYSPCTLEIFTINGQEADAEDFASNFKNAYVTKTREPNPEWEEERRQRQDYWAAVKYARDQLYEYYGTACHFFHGAHGDLIRIKNMCPDEILREASKNGLI